MGSKYTNTKEKMILKIRSIGSIIALILLVTCSVFALEDYTTATKLDVHFKVSSELILQNDAYDLKEIDLIMSYFPMDTATQKRISFQPFPQQPTIETKDSNQQVHYSLLQPFLDQTTNVLVVGYSAHVKTEQGFVKIPTKVAYPFTKYPAEITKYLQPTTSVDSTNEEIKSLAKSLVGDTDDAFIATLNLASWVSLNIQYNLSSQNIDATFPASWVLKNRQGVCDEITNLFIAMARSQGIPARFITGISYSNSPEVPTPWGAHGWAEVYFSDIGWVPFDVTYKQYGYVDPTHIVLAEQADASDAEIHAEWNDIDAKVKLGTLHIEVIDYDVDGSMEAFLKPEIRIMMPNTGLHSYNLVSLEVKNPFETYLAPSFTLVPTQGIISISKQTQLTLLRPYEKKTIWWIIKTDDSFDTNFVYTIPLGITSSYGGVNQKSFFADQFGVNAGEKEKKEWEVMIEKMNLDEISTTEKKPFSLSCMLLNTSILKQNKFAQIRCTVEIKPEFNLIPTNSKVQICFDKNCTKTIQELMLGITQPIPLMKSGPQLNIVTLYLEDKNATSNNGVQEENTINHNIKQQVSNQEIIPYYVIDNPSLTINATYPKKVRYNDLFNFTVDISKSSMNIPKNVIVKTNHSVIKQSVIIGDLEQRYTVWFPILAKYLNAGNDTIEIEVYYTDDDGKKYSSTKRFEIELVDVTFIQHIMIGFRDLSLWAQTWFE